MNDFSIRILVDKSAVVTCKWDFQNGRYEKLMPVEKVYNGVSHEMLRGVERSV